MDRTGHNLWFHADNSITWLQAKPARKHFDEVLKRLDLAHIGSRHTAHLWHTSQQRQTWMLACLPSSCRAHNRRTAEFSQLSANKTWGSSDPNDGENLKFMSSSAVAGCILHCCCPR